MSDQQPGFVFALARQKIMLDLYNSNVVEYLLFNMGAY